MIKLLPIAFVDLETTGLDPFKHEITEIGIVIAHQVTNVSEGQSRLQLISEHEILLRPEHIETANPNALKISKYHKKDRSLAVDQKTGLMEASRLLSGTLFIAQNVTLDWSFLIQASNTYNVEFDTKVHYHKLDLASMVFAKFYDEPRIQKCSLREMSEFFTVENKDAHSALSDARAAFEITNKVLSS